MAQLPGLARSRLPPYPQGLAARPLVIRTHPFAHQPAAPAQQGQVSLPDGLAETGCGLANTVCARANRARNGLVGRWSQPDTTRTAPCDFTAGGFRCRPRFPTRTRLSVVRSARRVGNPELMADGPRSSERELAMAGTVTGQPRSPNFNGLCTAAKPRGTTNRRIRQANASVFPRLRDERGGGARGRRTSRA